MRVGGGGGAGGFATEGVPSLVCYGDGSVFSLVRGKMQPAGEVSIEVSEVSFEVVYL